MINCFSCLRLSHRSHLFQNLYFEKRGEKKAEEEAAEKAGELVKKIVKIGILVPHSAAGQDLDGEVQAAIEDFRQRRRRNTEEKAQVVAASWGTYLNAALTI